MWGAHYKATLNFMRHEVTENTLQHKMRGVTLHSFQCVDFSEMNSLQGFSSSEALGVARLPSSMHLQV